MENRVEAIGRNTPVQTAPDVTATDGNSGIAKQGASAKPSLVITFGAQSRLAGNVALAQELPEEKSREGIVSADEFLKDQGVVNQI